jgi:hypothetical protein
LKEVAMPHATRVLVLAALALLASAIPVAHATDWNPPERITTNLVADRITSGSLFQFCGGTAAAWLAEASGQRFQILFSETDELTGHWRAPVPITTGTDFEYAPRLAGDGGCHLVWQRGSGPASEIMYAHRPYGGVWTAEPVTANATEDMTPDIADLWDGDGNVHIVWAGYDPITGGGKIFYATKTTSGFEVERLAGSELGPFWTGAEPKVAVAGDGIVHVVYRGGDYGDYHAHYARKAGGQWTYTTLFSGNANDFAADVAVWSNVWVAMSGNDGWGFPSRIYVRASGDGGLTFDPAALVSGSISASLDNLTTGWAGEIVVGSEVSGNVYTGNAIQSHSYGGWVPEYLPPRNQATERAAGAQDHCISRTVTWPGAISALYTNSRGGPPDSAEVYFITIPPAGATGEEHAAPGAPLRVVAAPNPFAAATVITFPLAPPPAGSRATIADVAGRRVRDLTAELAASLDGRVRWDGRNARGERVGAGVYLLRIVALGQETTARLVVLP